MKSLPKGQEQDLPEMVALLIRTWKECYSDFLPTSFLEKMNPEKQLNRHIRYFRSGASYFLIRNEAGKLAGFTSFGKNRNEFSPSEVELYTLYVDPKYQANGLGYRLLSAALNEAKGRYQSIEVSVLQKNPYQAFYLKNGFEVSGEETLDFGSFSEKALILRRPI